MSRNALQAVLDRAAQATPPVPAPPPAVKASTPSPRREKPRAAPVEAVTPEDQAQGAFYRPSREGKQLIAGHFPKSVAKQLKLLSVEDDTTVQELLAEALDLLFVKKGRARIAEITKRQD